MKPLPQAVQDAFPCRTGVLPERPWWDRTDNGMTMWREYRRKDGAETRPYPRNRIDSAREIVEGIEERTRYTSVQKLVAIDSERPLPHPGYRAGQVWAAEDGSSVVITNSNQTTPRFREDYPYLMADPSCPWLAPWSPAEVKP